MLIGSFKPYDEDACPCHGHNCHKNNPRIVDLPIKSQRSVIYLFPNPGVSVFLKSPINLSKLMGRLDHRVIAKYHRHPVLMATFPVPLYLTDIYLNLGYG